MPTDRSPDPAPPEIPPTLRAKYNEVQQAKLLHDMAKEAATSARKAWESKQDEFDDLFQRMSIGAGPLFGGETVALDGEVS